MKEENGNVTFDGVKLQYCDIIADFDDEERNARTRILYYPETKKYYLHKMRNGNVEQFYECPPFWNPVFVKNIRER